MGRPSALMRSIKKNNDLRLTVHGSRGFTLIELVVVITLLGIVGGSILIYFFGVKRSGDPVLRTQAIELAQEKMDRILADKKNSSRGFSYIQNSNYAAESPVSGISPSFNRSVDIFCVLEADLNISNGTIPNCSTTDFKAKRVKVTVTSPNNESVYLVTVLANY